MLMLILIVLVLPSPATLAWYICRRGRGGLAWYDTISIETIDTDTISLHYSYPQPTHT